MIESVSQFLSLVEDDTDEARASIRHAEASESLWFEILEIHPELVRVVTLNKGLPDSVLHMLAKHPDTDVRVDIANKRKLSLDVFELLASDEDESVRARLAWNKKTPIEILKQLADDEEEVVSGPARDRLASA